MAHAATNLSFIYFHEADYQNAIKYADLAMKHNRYNAKALVNKGNCMFMRGDSSTRAPCTRRRWAPRPTASRRSTTSASSTSGSATTPSALGLFEKLHQIVPSSIEVIWQIGDLFDQSGQPRTAIKWFKILNARVPTDPSRLARIGNIYL